MKKALTILAIFAAALAAWIVLFPSKNPFKKIFGKPGTNTTTAQPTNQPINTGTTQPGSFMPTVTVVQDLSGFPLKQGSRGQYVKTMQAALNARFGSDLVIDGIFGPKTYKAISANGFNADLVTWAVYKQIVGLK